MGHARERLAREFGLFVVVADDVGGPVAELVELDAQHDDRAQQRLRAVAVDVGAGVLVDHLREVVAHLLEALGAGARGTDEERRGKAQRSGERAHGDSWGGGNDAFPHGLVIGAARAPSRSRLRKVRRARRVR